MGCCVSLCMPDMNKHMNNHMQAHQRAMGAGMGTAGGAGGRGAAPQPGGPPVPGQSPFRGPFAGIANQMAGGIMRQVGSQMAAAAEAAAKQAAIDFQQGPYIQQDGLVIIPFIDGMWGFSPAFPPALAGAMAAEEYWSVLLPLNAFSIKTAQENNVADSQGRIMTGMSNQLNAGAAGLGGMMQAAQNAAGEARKANAVRQAVMRQIQPMMLRANQTTAAKGIIWSLEKHTWTTVSTTTDSHHHTSSRTVHHEQYIILLRAKSAAQQLAMVGASNGGFNAMSVNHAIRGNVPGCVMPKAPEPNQVQNPVFGMQQQQQQQQQQAPPASPAPSLPPRRRAAPPPPGPQL